MNSQNNTDSYKTYFRDAEIFALREGGRLLQALRQTLDEILTETPEEAPEQPEE